MTRSVALALLLLGCAPELGADPAADPADDVTAAADPADPTADDLVRVDVRGTAASIRAVLAQVQALPPERRERAATALRRLTVRCPYTRAAMQLPLALHAAVLAIPADRLDRLVQHDWETLQHGLTTHVAVLDALGVQLQPPAPGDALYHPELGVMVDRTQLQTSNDPIALTARLVQELPALAASIDAATHSAIDADSEQVALETGVVRPCPRSPWATLPGQPWTLGMQLGGWHDALRRVAPFVHDPDTLAQIEAMIDLLDTFGEVSLG